MKGEKKKKQSWDCKEDGSAKCTGVVTNCLSCQKTGYKTTGTATFLPNGKLSSEVGEEGWDCRSKCQAGAKQGPSGTEQYLDFKRCFGSG